MAKFIIQPVHVDDVILGILNSIKTHKTGIINFVGKPILLKDYLKRLANNTYHKEIFIINIPMTLCMFFLKHLQNCPKIRYSTPIICCCYKEVK